MISKIKKIFNNNWQLLLIFLLSFSIYVFCGFYLSNGDSIASYGFSHAIKNGQIPYLDFNTISTPLHAFFGALFLLVCDEFLMFLFGQCILIVIMFYFLFKMLGNRAWCVFLSMIIFKFFGFMPTYNFCCVVMSVIVLYLESKYEEKDYLIGLFLGLCFLSKHTVGGLLLITSLIICFKEWKKLLKRVAGFLIPVVIFFVYLVWSNSLMSFIDLCFLGLLDFGSNNGSITTFWFFVSVILLIFNIIILKKDKNKLDYYGFAYYGFLLPLFDLHHFAVYFVCFVILALFHVNEFNKSRLILIWGLIIEFLLFNFFMGIRGYDTKFYNDTLHFKYRYNYVIDYNIKKKYDKLINKYKNQNLILVMYYSMEYNIVNDRELSYFDVFMYGNHGYNGTKKMINKIDNMKDVYFIVNIDDYKSSGIRGSQFNKEICDYIFLVSDLVEESEDLFVYYKEE